VYIYDFTTVYEQTVEEGRGLTISIKARRVRETQHRRRVSTIVTPFSLERMHRLALSLTPTMIEFQ
jgi:hypothetical protein